MTLHLHRAPRADALADQLGDLLATPLPDPFASEVVAVPARGIERWLSQRLSHRLGAGPAGGDGVCAGVDFLSPRSLVSLLLGRERDDPWDPDRLVWPVLDVLDASLDEPWAATLARHLGHGVDGAEGELKQARRWSVARRLAGLLASYAAQRPTLLADWRAGRDLDGAGGDLDGDLLWQAELWRRVVPHVGEPAPDERHAATLERLAQGDPALDLPGRLSLFGHTRLPVTEVALLAALARQRGARVTANEPQPHRAELVRRSLAALAGEVEVTSWDGRGGPWPEGAFDRVLVDAPCSGLGALRRRPEARWRKQPSDLDELVPLQQALLTRALELVRVGGAVVYATCSPVLAETVEVVDAVLEGRGDVVRGETHQLWPHEHATDAMSWTVLVRRDQKW